GRACGCEADAGWEARVRISAAALAGLLAAGSALAETIVLTGATIHPVSGPDIPNGTVVIRDGKIAAVGAAVEVPAGAKTVDVKGRHVYPSLFPAITDLGLVEISSVRATVDTTQLAQINPQPPAHFPLTPHPHPP